MGHCGFEWVEEKKLWGRVQWLRAGGVEGFWAVSLRTNNEIVRHTNPSRLVGNLPEFEKSDKGSLLSLR